MSATVTDNLLANLIEQAHAPMFVRVWALAALRADLSGVARMDELEVQAELARPGERHEKRDSVRRAVRRAVELGLLAEGSTSDSLKLTGDTRAWTGRFSL